MRRLSRQLPSRGASVIITVDCGITSGDEVRQAKQLGIDVILTDHHTPMGAPPEAFATVAPTNAYPFPFLTGAGLAFKLVQAIYQRLESPVPAGALELASLGTVADMAPLLGENRAIATLGLEKLRETERPGLLALLSAAGVDRESLDHESIPFIIAPRLNAAGRMDSAELAFSLLTEEDPLAVQELATRIEALNRERRSLTQELVDEGMRLAAEQVEEGQRLLFLVGEQFNPGVSGLVAGRLVERYSRPAVVVAVDGDVARASGRSVPDYHLAQALSECGELFLHYGGHPAAAGFVARTDALDAIRQSMQTSARERLRDATLEPTLRIDAEADFADIPGQDDGFRSPACALRAGEPASGIHGAWRSGDLEAADGHAGSAHAAATAPERHGVGGGGVQPVVAGGRGRAWPHRRGLHAGAQYVQRPHSAADAPAGTTRGGVKGRDGSARLQQHVNGKGALVWTGLSS